MEQQKKEKKKMNEMGVFIKETCKKREDKDNKFY